MSVKKRPLYELLEEWCKRALRRGITGDPNDTNLMEVSGIFEVLRNGDIPTEVAHSIAERFHYLPDMLNCARHPVQAEFIRQALLDLSSRSD